MTETITTNAAEPDKTSVRKSPIGALIDRVLAKHPAQDVGARIGLKLLVGAITEVISLATKDIRANRREIDDLKRRIDLAEQRARLDYRGIWTAGTVYPAASWVTFDGSLWTATEDTSSRPGDGPTPWRLAVKRGKDGRDTRR